jgi:hypothetical protein
MISVMMMFLSLSLPPPLYRYQQTVILAISAVSLSPKKQAAGGRRGSFSYFEGNVVWLEVHNP